MLSLVLSTVFSAGFGLGIRTAQGLGANLAAAGAVNYLTATLLNLALALIAGSPAPGPLGFAIGVPGGITYATAFFAVYLLTRYRGASVTGAVIRLSSVIPVAASLLLWGERLDAWQAAGAALAMASLPLLSFRGSAPAAAAAAADAAPPDARRGGWLVPGLFAINGMCLLVTRTWQQTGITGSDSSFLVVVFGAAALTAWTVWALQRHGIRWLDVACGAAIGTSNALSNLFTVKALHVLPGTVVYPFYSAVGLLITVAVSRVAWRERFGRLGTAGIALAGIAIVLVNLGSR
jgi:multidrug transporter EmrE-like cation transporter